MQNDTCLDLDAVRAARTERDPYYYMIAGDVIRPNVRDALRADFPSIRQPGFFPEEDLECRGSFVRLLDEMKRPELSRIVSDKLDIELVEKPKMITIRRLSASKDGRIHTDSQSKIATLLIYLNDAWDAPVEGRLRVLRNGHDFEAMTDEISPVTGSLFAFRRADNSWHGHKPFVGERRVVQMTWLQSEADVERKRKRGFVSLLLKKVNPFS